MTTTIQDVQARLGRDPEDLRKYRVTIQVCSKKRPGLKSSTDIDPGEAASQHQLIRMVGAAGAACAEYLGERYGDNIDTGEAYRDAVRAFEGECKLVTAVAESAYEKLKRIEAHVARLSDEKRELVQRLRYLVDHYGKLLPREAAWIDQRIQEIHSE